MNFIKRHPLLCLAVVGIFIVIATDVRGRIYETPDYICWAIMAIVTYACIWLDKKWVAVIVALAFFVATTPVHAELDPEPFPLLVVMVVAVIVGGGIVGCRVAKKCNRIARARESNMVAEAWSPAGAPGEYGATWTYTEPGYCFSARDFNPKPPVTTTLDIIVTSPTSAVTRVSAGCGEQYSQTFEEFSQELAEHGLNTEEESYSRNLQPCDSELVPLRFDLRTRTVSLAPTSGIAVSVEATQDLLTWVPMLRMEAGIGTHISFQDATTDQARFYRVKVGRD